MVVDSDMFPEESNVPLPAPMLCQLARSRPFPQPRHQGVQRHLHMNRGQQDLHIHLARWTLQWALQNVFKPYFNLFSASKSEFAWRVWKTCQGVAEGWLGSRCACLCRNPNTNTTLCPHLRPRWTCSLSTAFCELPGILWLCIAVLRQRTADAVGPARQWSAWRCENLAFVLLGECLFDFTQIHRMNLESIFWEGRAEDGLLS